MDVKQYEEFFALDLPVTYKGLLIYPVKVKEYFQFNRSVVCLSIDKNKMPVIDPELTVQIIKMSDLDFIVFMTEACNDEYSFVNMFYDIMSLCLKPDKIHLYENNGKIFAEVIQNDQSFIVDGEDFKTIKSIVLYQNIVDYDDSYIDPKVEEALKAAQEVKNRQGDKICGFEDQIVCAKISSGASFDEIYEWTLRKFSKVLEREDIKLNYTICKTGEMSGMVEFKTPIPHWMHEVSHKKYDNLLIGLDSVKDKVSGATAKQEQINKLRQ